MSTNVRIEGEQARLVERERRAHRVSVVLSFPLSHTAMPFRFALLALAFLLALPVAAQERGNDEPRKSPNASVSQTIGTTQVTVGYSRPSVRDRVIFGELVPFDAVWRTGANEATTISFSDAVMFGGQEVPAGTYALFTMPGQESWSVMVNTADEQWGAMDYDAEQNVATVEVKPEAATAAEMMTFYFDNVTDTEGMLVLHWDETRVPVMISTQ